MAERKLSYEQITDIAEAHAAGRSLGSLAGEYGVTSNALAVRLKRRGLFVRGATKRKLSDEQVTEIAEAYKAGRPAASLASEYGVTPNVITKQLKRRGLHIRDCGEALRLSSRQRCGAPRKQTPATAHGSGMRVCVNCKKERPPTDFAENKKKKGHTVAQCSGCKAKAESYRQRLRAQVLHAYGGRCACCGESMPEFLSVDHVHNDGAEHRREMKAHGFSFYVWLRKMGFPKDRFQLLCHNCNFAKGQYGKCPHEAARRAEATPAAA